MPARPTSVYGETVMQLVAQGYGDGIDFGIGEEFGISRAILLAEVCADRQAETWGAALQIVQDQGMAIAGFIEDMARNYGKSPKLADLADATVQKDPWRLMCDSALLLTKLEKAAYAAMQQVVTLEKQLNKAWAVRPKRGCRHGRLRGSPDAAL